jgi:hypothetical protein
MKIDAFPLPSSFKRLAEEGIQLPQGADILRVDVDTSEGRIKIIASFAEAAPMIRRNLFVTDIGGEVPDDYLPRLLFLGTFHVFGLMERIFDGAARSFALFIEREESYWMRNPADIIYDLLRDNPRVDLPRLQRWTERARAYYNEPVAEGYDADAHQGGA